MTEFPEIDKTWTLFLDRDGVINVRNFGGYITRKEDFQFLPDVPEAITALSVIFGRIIVCTNQQGIAKGLFSKSNLDEIHRYMKHEIAERGGKIDGVFAACELKSDEKNTRKPQPFMALEAKKQFPEIDFNKSIMVGDTDSDIIFGRNLGMKTVLIESEEKVKEQADFKINGLWELLKLVQRK